MRNISVAAAAIAHAGTCFHHGCTTGRDEGAPHRRPAVDLPGEQVLPHAAEIADLRPARAAFLEVLRDGPALGRIALVVDVPDQSFTFIAHGIASILTLVKFEV